MQSDDRLIRRIRRKQDREAADILVGRYYREIYAFVYRQTGDRELSMDLTQEIFMLILQKIHFFDEKKGTFRTWAYRIAANKVTDYYQSRAHQMRQMERPLATGGEGEPLIEGAGEDFRDVAEKIVQREYIHEIMADVAQYPAEWVRIFQMRCFEEMTFAEIASELGLSENTAKTRFYRMVGRIRRHFT